MSNTKPSTLKDFFNGRRRKATLKQWTHLKTRAGEPRIRLDLKLPLLNEDVIGMPDPISEAFTVMAKDASKLDRSSINIQFLGMTIETFSGDNGGAPTVSCTGAMLHKFALVSSGEGEKRELDLHCVAYMPANVQLRDFAWDHNHGAFFMTAEYSQSEMEFTDEEVAEEEEEDEEEEEEVLAAAPATPTKATKPAKGKSAPKDLAAFHASHPEGEMVGVSENFD